MKPFAPMDASPAFIRAADVDPEARRQLLALARTAIEAAVRAEPLRPVDQADLHQDARRPFGAFVTLTRGEALRGCIGRLDFERALWANVIDAAVAAALDDPRFPPVRSDELGAVAIEVSVLDPPTEIDDPAAFDASRHGILIEHGWRRGLLLPVVARRYGWDERRTLEAVCEKAGLPRDAWRDPDARLLTFTAAEFDEAELGRRD
jgi:AmmeMemoRadiSam system protein A